MSFTEWLSQRFFHFVVDHQLVYNTCWEDPRLDREALALSSDDNVLVITSAGCNALDYVLTEPNHVYAVDVNPRQNALLELKLACLRRLEYEDFFAMFGLGRLARAEAIYHSVLRGLLSDWPRAYWDQHIRFFDDPRRPFYYRGASGAFARIMRAYIERIVKVGSDVERILAASTVDEQRKIYDEDLRERFWTRSLRFALRRDAVLSMLGVPQAQRRQIDTQYRGGMVQFIQDCVEAVFARLPLSDNYFWRVYLSGKYSAECCPEYLRSENFQRLRSGLANRISVHTASVQQFLDAHEGQISRFVLLDHMDWMAGQFWPLLQGEWQAIVNRAAPGTRLIWRSGGLRTDYVDRVPVRYQGGRCLVGEILAYQRERAEGLHARCRVHTYGSFYIAGLAA